MAWNNYQKPSVKLPNHHHKDDAKWIEEILLSMKPEFRVKACVKYNDAYQESFDNETLRHRKEGKARYAANDMLRNGAKHPLVRR